MPELGSVAMHVRAACLTVTESLVYTCVSAGDGVTGVLDPVATCTTTAVCSHWG